MIKKVSYIFLIILLINGCTIVNNKNKFILQRNIEISQISTDGYYYSIDDRDIKTGFSGKVLNMRVLLKNGFIKEVPNGYYEQCGRNVSLECEIKMSEKMLDEYQNYNLKNGDKRSSNINLWDWGKYNINNDSVLIQKFYNYLGNYYLIEERGKIIDNFSFILTKKIDYRTKATYVINEMYSFKKYDVSKMYNKYPLNL